MKTTPYLVLLFFALFTLSCDGKVDGVGSSEDVASTANNAIEKAEEKTSSVDDRIDGTDILGKWNAVEMKMVGSTNEDGVSMEFDGVTSSVGENNFIEFSADNIFLAQNSVMQMEMNFNIPEMGKMSRTIPISNEFSESGKWVKNGDLLTINTPEGEVIDYIIEELTSETLVISADENSIVIGDDIPPGAKMKMTMVFER